MSPHRRALVLEMGTHPFELGMHAILVAIGVTGFIPGAQSPSIVAAFPGRWEYAWYGLVVVSPLVALVGCLLGYRADRRVTSLYIERIGLCGLPAICPSFLSAVLDAGGRSSLTGGLSFGGIGVLALWRIRHINRDLAKLRAAVADPALASPPLAEPPPRGD